MNDNFYASGGQKHPEQVQGCCGEEAPHFGGAGLCVRLRHHRQLELSHHNIRSKI